MQGSRDSCISGEKCYTYPATQGREGLSETVNKQVLGMANPLASLADFQCQAWGLNLQYSKVAQQ